MAQTEREVIQSNVLRNYYTEKDVVTSVEGILKATSIVSCVACAGAGVAGGGSVGSVAALVGAALLTLLYSAAILSVPLCAPTLWFYTDLIISAAVGALLLITPILSLALYESWRAIHYVHGLFGLITASLVMASAIKTFISVSRHFEGPQRNETEQPQVPPMELQI